jgi:hypothetical protein
VADSSCIWKGRVFDFLSGRKKPSTHVKTEREHPPSHVCYPWHVEITLNIPDEFGRQVTPEGSEPARVALEALALEGYRAERLSESAVRQMLGFETRMEVHAFLKEHGVYLHYDIADLDRDQASAEKLRGRLQVERSSGKLR